MHAQGGPMVPGIVHIGQPSYLEGGRGMSEDEFGLVAAGWLEERIRELGPDNVAAFIGEPVQGAGGVIIPPKTYWPEIQRICDKYGILLIADEVICGFGRLGAWFGSELMGIKPDLIAFAKGVTSGYIPLGGVLVGDRVADVLTGQGRRLQSRLHLLGPSGRLRRGAREHPHHPRRSSWCRRSRRTPGLT